MQDYDAAYRAFHWELPSHFNFGIDVVDRWAAERPDHLALIWSDAEGRERRFAYREIARFSDRLGAALQRAGLGNGDRVLVMFPRVPAWQIAMVALLKIGAIPIPCIEMLTEKDVAYRLENAAVRAAIVSEGQVGKVPRDQVLKARVVVGEAEGWTPIAHLLEAEQGKIRPVPMAVDDPAILFYTSGSTGEPKGVTHAARALFTWRVSAWYWLDLGADDVMWCIADTSWSKAGTSILFGPWSCGSTVVFHQGPFDPAGRFDVLARYGVTVFYASAAELRRLVLEDSRDLPALRLTVSAWRRLTGVALLDGWSDRNPDDGSELSCLAGEAGLYGQATARHGDTGPRRTGWAQAIGQPGELAIRLPHPQLMLVYWRNPERTASAEIEIGSQRYFRTSDRVRLDEEGYHFHEGRSDDVINSSGYRIGPMEVENALAEHPAVLESAAVASPDPLRGEVVKAFVILAPGHAGEQGLIEALQAHCKLAIGPYRYPRRIAFVGDLPKTPTGKIRRRLLRDREFAEEESP